MRALLLTRAHSLEETGIAPNLRISPGSPAGAANSRCPDSFAAALAECLKSYLSVGYPHINLAAQLLSCSVRTLQRRLHEEGTNYSEVVEEARRSSAMHALLKTDTSLPDLAAQLGYSEQSAFTRAFRRWTGTTPNRYRIQATTQGGND